MYIFSKQVLVNPAVVSSEIHMGTIISRERARVTNGPIADSRLSSLDLPMS